MWYWNQDNFEGILAVADSIAHESRWSDFAEYCRLREKGLRKKALASIDNLITAADSWPTNERRRFVTWIIEAQQRLPEVHQLIVTPLQRKLIEPTLDEWSHAHPGDPIPKRLLGLATGNVDCFQQALDLAPDDDISRFRIISRLVYDVDYQCHHLPDYFIGEPSKALDDLNVARDLSKLFVDKSIAESLADEFTELTNKVNDWVVFQSSHQKSFAGWCDDNKRNYTWCRAYHYDA
ncbi:MAG: hypothetical protein RJP95_02620 [Pirellulales bacterium]